MLRPLLLTLLAFVTTARTAPRAAFTTHPTYQTPAGEAFVLTEIATDPDYGYSETQPIKVGTGSANDGPKNERRFLNALAGPNGEPISYTRGGSCCGVKSKNGFMGVAMLDFYEVTWQGSTDTATLYLNMYDPGELKAPVGFAIRK